jgi:ribonuclease R
MPKKPTLTDPHFEREKRKYERPIPSRELILEVLQQAGAPLSRTRLTKLLDLTSNYERDALERRLSAMQRDGQLMQNRRGHYCLIEKLHLIPGSIQAHPEGYGFVIPTDGSEDIYLGPRQMRGILDGDL